MAEAGAQSAYRGYRLQALYALGRMLDPAAKASWRFRPEGLEDLDILEDSRCVETIQVKSTPDFSLSNLSPDKPNGFLRRILRHQGTPEAPSIRLISFGGLGPEMRGVRDGESHAQRKVSQKLEEHGYSASEVAWILSCVGIEEHNEAETRARILEHLQDQITGIDPVAALDILTCWLYQQAEASSVIDREQLVEKARQIGLCLSEQQAHHAEWFKAIVPLEDKLIPQHLRDQLQKQFREGIDASYEHILANLDFRRDEKLARITEGFSTNKVVIVHGASGQGKSTLGFRYMHDFYPASWRFHIRLVENRQHALRIARALAGYARAVQMPMAVYIDVSPGNIDWPELVRELFLLDQFQILVTIREEDLRRANISSASFEYSDLELSLNEDEALLVYQGAESVGQITSFLAFEEAWDRFGRTGPMMEFAYLLAHKATLRDRLQQQVNRIRQRVSMGAATDELRLLRLVAVASAYGARVDLSLLRRVIALPDLEGVLQLYENEYLVRVTPDGRYVSGLHPVRSGILVDLLTHPFTEPWGESFSDVLPLVVEQDLESFVFHSLTERVADGLAIRESIERVEPRTWSGIAGIGRAMLWLGVKDYVDSIMPILDEARRDFGSAFGYVIDFDLMGLLDAGSSVWWESLGNIISPERKQLIRALRAKQPPKDGVFEHISSWLRLGHRQPADPQSTQDWSGVAFLLFWSSKLGIEPRFDVWLSDEALDAASTGLTLTELADLSAALHRSNKDRHLLWLKSKEQLFETRLANERAVVALEIRPDTSLAVHFLPAMVVQNHKEKIPEGSFGEQLHNDTIELIGVVRRLFPLHNAYASQGYGFRLGSSLPSPFDDYTEKTGIPAHRLPLAWEVQPNAWFQGLCTLRYRLDTWPEYVEATLDLRRQISECLDAILRGVTKYQRRDKPLNIASSDSTMAIWEDCLQRVREPLLLPQCAADPWGFTYEGQSQETVGRLDIRWSIRCPSLYLQRYKPFLECSREYTNALSSFLWQAQHVCLANFTIGRMPQNDARMPNLVEKLLDSGIRTDLAHMSTYNLYDAHSALEPYQARFRKMFSTYVQSGELSELECREREILSKLWPAWYFFAFEPSVPWADPAHQIATKVLAEKKRIEARIKDACVRLEEARVSVIDSMPPWNDEPTLWLRLDLAFAVELYARVETLIGALREIMGTSDKTDLSYHVRERNWKYVAIVPVVRGRMMSDQAWRLHMETTIVHQADFEKHPWSYVPQPLPDTQLGALGIRIWESESMDLANSMRSGIAGSSLLLEQMADLVHIPDMTEVGMEVISDYMARQAKVFSEQMQTAYDAAAGMLSYYNALSDAEKATRTSLFEAVAGLRDLHPLIVPGEDCGESGCYRLSLDQIVAFAQKLSEARPIAEMVWLYWVDDAIEQIVHAGSI